MGSAGPVGHKMAPRPNAKEQLQLKGFSFERLDFVG
jgi:hypothetical protein